VERRAERRGDGAVHDLRCNRLCSIGDNFWIETGTGQRVHKVDGKAMRLGQTRIFQDADRRGLSKVQQRIARSTTVAVDTVASDGR
jgi:uncharacterized protein YxjI